MEFARVKKEVCAMIGFPEEDASGKVILEDKRGVKLKHPSGNVYAWSFEEIEEEMYVLTALTTLQHRLKREYSAAICRQTNGKRPSGFMRGLQFAITEVDKSIEEEEKK